MLEGDKLYAEKCATFTLISLYFIPITIHTDFPEAYTISPNLTYIYTGRLYTIAPHQSICNVSYWGTYMYSQYRLAVHAIQLSYT